MKQLGNLAVVCAGRHDTLLQVLNGMVTVHVRRWPEKKNFLLDVSDDKKIAELIMELNHGSLKEEPRTEIDAAA